MRVTGGSSKVSFTHLNQSRNCRPEDACTWIGNPVHGTADENWSIVRSEIVHNPIVDGWRRPSAYSFDKSETRQVKGHIDGQFLFGWSNNPKGGARLRIDGALFSVVGSTRFTAPSQNEISAIRTRALNQAKNQKLDFAMAIATRKQTAGMLGQMAGTLATAYGQARRRNFAAAAKTLGIQNNVRQGTKSVSSGWLQLQFGWRPLMNDIYGAYQTLVSPIPEEGKLVVVRVSNRDSTATSVDSSYSPWGSGYVTGHYRLDETHTRDVKASYWYKIDEAGLYSINQTGLIDPMVVAWDLVPFSFVVDWLLPVGNFLRACTADVGLQYLGGSMTYFEKSTVKITSTRATTPSVVQGNYRDNKGSCSFGGSATNLRMRRTVESAPSASLYVKNPFSTFTVVTSLSLLTQRFQSSKPWKDLGRQTRRGG